MKTQTISCAVFFLSTEVGGGMPSGRGGFGVSGKEIPSSREVDFHSFWPCIENWWD